MPFIAILNVCCSPNPLQERSFLPKRAAIKKNSRRRRPLLLPHAFYCYPKWLLLSQSASGKEYVLLLSHAFYCYPKCLLLSQSASGKELLFGAHGCPRVLLAVVHRETFVIGRRLLLAGVYWQAFAIGSSNVDNGDNDDNVQMLLGGIFQRKVVHLSKCFWGAFFKGRWSICLNVFGGIFQRKVVHLSKCFWVHFSKEGGPFV